MSNFKCMTLFRNYYLMSRGLYTLRMDGNDETIRAFPKNRIAIKNMYFICESNIVIISVLQWACRIGIKYQLMRLYMIPLLIVHEKHNSTEFLKPYRNECETIQYEFMRKLNAALYAPTYTLSSLFKAVAFDDKPN